MYNQVFIGDNDKMKYGTNSEVRVSQTITSIYQSTVNTGYPQCLKSLELIQKYRCCKVNANKTLNKPKDKGINLLPDILCKILSFKQSQNQQDARKYQSKNQDHSLEYIYCQCQKIQNNYCSLILNWIDDHYYWKTDKQFIQVYQHYNRKKDHQILSQIQEQLIKKTDILGVNIQPSKLNKLANIVSNYLKHLHYYNKYHELAAQSDIYLWVALGITYHLQLEQQQKCTERRQQLTFWAMDIILTKFRCLKNEQLQKHTKNVVQHLQYYFPQWCKYLHEHMKHPYSLNRIVKEWVSQMMFGYMGIQCIGFYLNSFYKIGWSYLYRIILSYFSARVQKLKNCEIFMNGQISNEQILQKLIDSQEQWPIIFCQASTYKNV